MSLAITPHTESELLTRLQTVRLKGFGQPEIYRNTFLEVYSCPIELLVPCQGYVLMDRVADIQRLRDRVMEGYAGLDIFNMPGWGLHQVGGGSTGYLDITLDDVTTFPILPPMVERFDARASDGGIDMDACLVNDGMHRVYAAKLSGLHEITCVISSKPDWPYYAYSNESGWEGVQEIRGALPENFPKKRYRLPDPVMYKQLYRDFNSVFPGVQEDRAKGLIA